MATIEPLRTDPTSISRIKKHSASLRLWHWLNFIVISGSLTTVMINSTITKGHSTTPLITDALQKSGARVTSDQAKAASHALSDSVWDIHVYFGYALAVLLLFRIILEYFQLADQKFLRKIKTVYTQFKKTKAKREAARHEFVVKVIYGIFYLLLVIMVVTGLFLAFEDELAAFKSIRHSVKNVHGFCMYLVLAFIVVHLAGVFLAERKKESAGIVSDMINGGENKL